MINVERWNLAHPVGTPVRYFPNLDPKPDEWWDTHTVDKARMLADIPVVKIHGFPMVVPLSRLVVVDPGERKALDCLTYITEIIDDIDTENVDAATLQGVLTEIHCTCLAADARLDMDSQSHVPARKPHLLERGMKIMDLLVSAHDGGDIDLQDVTHEVLEEIDDWRKDASAILNPISSNEKTP